MVASGAVMLLINTYRLFRIRLLNKEYQEYFSALSQGNATLDFVRRQPEIKDLLTKADLGKPKIPRTEALGLGQIINHELDVINNMTMNDQQVVQLMMRLFFEAEGTFSYRIRQSINPIFWLETVIFLPSVLLGFVGVSPTSWFSKMANFVMWIFAAVGFVFSLPDFYDLRDAVSTYLAEFLKSDTSK